MSSCKGETSFFVGSITTRRAAREGSSTGGAGSSGGWGDKGGRGGSVGVETGEDGTAMALG